MMLSNVLLDSAVALLISTCNLDKWFQDAFPPAPLERQYNPATPKETLRMHLGTYITVPLQPGPLGGPVRSS